MMWQGKALGAVVGVFTAGPVGALFGTFIGHLFDVEAETRLRSRPPETGWLRAEGARTRSPSDGRTALSTRRRCGRYERAGPAARPRVCACPTVVTLSSASRSGFARPSGDKPPPEGPWSSEVEGFALGAPPASAS